MRMCVFGAGWGVLDDLDFECVYSCVFCEFIHEFLWDRVVELFAQVLGGVEDCAVVENKVDVLVLVCVVSACA